MTGGARLRRALIPVPCPSRLDGVSPHPAHGTQFEVKYFNSSICSRSFNASSNPSAMSDKSLLVRIHRPIGSTLHQIRTLPDRAIFCSEPVLKKIPLTELAKCIIELIHY